MKLFLSLLIFLSIPFCKIIAQENYDFDKPAMIVRFDHSEVYYDQALSLLINKIKTIDYSKITILSLSKSNNITNINSEAYYIKNIMIQSDIEAKNIIFINEINDNIEFDEIRIFVN